MSEVGDDEFSVILDKGTMDAMFTDSSDEVVAQIHQMLSEVSRVLRVGGRYICISLAQEHILSKLVAHFSQE